MTNHKEGRAMKKAFSAILTILCVFLLTPAGSTDVGDLVAEGKELMKYSQQLIDKGEMLKAYKDQDKTWLVDQGNQIVKEGTGIMEKGEMMSSGPGRSNTQEVGEEMRKAGNLLLEMGKKKDPLTEKDKEKIVKKGETMIGLGKLKLEEAKTMAP
jgi:hypothetical protein